MADLITIGASVGRAKGKECYNVPSDQAKVSKLLNRIDSADGGARVNGQGTLPESESQFTPGKVLPKLYDAIVAFQKRQHLPYQDGHIDPGQTTIRHLNDVANRPAPAPAPKSDDLPDTSPWRSLPPRLLDTLRVSYKNRTDDNRTLPWGFGFDKGNSAANMTFQQVLDNMGKARIDTIKAVFDRAIAINGLWDQVTEILTDWKTTSSTGFKFNAKTTSILRDFLNKSDKFCGDWALFASMHQDGQHRDCFREMVVPSSPGLHVCVVTAAELDSNSGQHDIHIDPNQICGGKSADGKCIYKHIIDHAVDMLPDLLAKKVRPLLEEALKKINIAAPNEDEIRKAVREALQDVRDIMRALGMEDQIDAIVNDIVQRISKMLEALKSGKLAHADPSHYVPPQIPV